MLQQRGAFEAAVPWSLDVSIIVACARLSMQRPGVKERLFVHALVCPYAAPWRERALIRPCTRLSMYSFVHKQRPGAKEHSFVHALICPYAAPWRERALVQGDVLAPVCIPASHGDPHRLVWTWRRSFPAHSKQTFPQVF